MEEQKKKNKETNEMETVKDKTGKPMMKPKWGPNAHGHMDIVMKDPDAFARDVKVFHGYEFEVKVYKFYAEDLQKAGLTPAELRACAKLIDDLDPELLIDESDEDAEDEIPAELAELLADPPTQEEQASDGGPGDNPST